MGASIRTYWQEGNTMQAGQPIWFMQEGQKVYAIVTQVLPNKQGVMAVTSKDAKAAIMVPEPHKIRELAEAMKVAESLGFEVKKTKAPEKEQPKAVQPVKPSTAYADALAALDKPNLLDAMHLYGMGIKLPEGIELPKADEKTTPIDKMFF